ncbi:MAG: pilus assembly protein TadG-related protein, partial [Nocardioidaceae bacterium]
MRRREDGATTILIAVIAVIIFAMAVVAVDLTNAYSRKRDIQTDADFAALAASQEEEFPAETPQPLAGDPVVTMVADYIVENFPQDDQCSNWGGDNRANCDSEATLRMNLANSILVDNDWKNGEVRYGKFTTDALIGIPTDLAEPRAYFEEDPLFLTVVTPRAQVDFGFAGIFGPGAPSNTKVYASATVALRSPGEGVMPVYAVAGCDYGRQTITDPAAGHTEPVPVPPLLFDTDTNNARLDTPTTTAPNPIPDQVSVNAATTAVTILGSQLLNTDPDPAKGTPLIPDEVSVGYFLPAGSPGGPLLVERPIKLTPLFAGDPVSTNTALISDIPTSVSAVEGVWYVRV